MSYRDGSMQSLAINTQCKTLSYIVYYIPDIHLMNSHISLAFIRPWLLRQNAEALNGISPQHALQHLSINLKLISLHMTTQLMNVFNRSFNAQFSKLMPDKIMTDLAHKIT